MKSSSSLDIHFLVEELQFLVGSRLDKLYEKDKKELLLQFYVTSKGKQLIKITPNYFYLTSSKEDSDEPSGFCMQLRKYLDSSRLKELSQLESERIIRLTFERKENKYNLYIELFGNGNIILTDEKDSIITASLYHTWKDRDIKAKMKYDYPKKDYNLFKTKDLSELIKNSDKQNIVKTLAIDLGLGGSHSEELCKLADVDKNKKPDEITKEEITRLNSSLKKLIANTPKSLSEELDKEISEISSLPKENPGLMQIKNIIKKQEEKIKEMEEKAEKESKKADLIYAKYQLIDGILKEINKAREKYSWGEIKSRLKGHKIVKDINLKDKTILVELEP